MKTPSSSPRSLLRAIPAVLTLIGSLIAASSAQAKSADATPTPAPTPTTDTKATSSFEERAAKIQQALREQQQVAGVDCEKAPDQQQAWWGNWHNWHNGGWHNGGWHNWNNWHNWHNW